MIGEALEVEEREELQRGPAAPALLSPDPRQAEGVAREVGLCSPTRTFSSTVKVGNSARF
jgi:hypothetical protein